MRIHGHNLGDHFRLLTPLLALITAVWVLRIILGAVGVPDKVVRIFSVNVTAAASTLLAVVIIHWRRFGSYSNVVVAAFVLMNWSQLLIIGAIGFSVLTGIQTVFSAPEYSFGLSPARHMIGHLTFGLGSGSLLGAAIGCLLLWMLRTLVPARAGR